MRKTIDWKRIGILSVSLIALLILVSGCATDGVVSAAGAEAPSNSGISVTGYGEATGSPDIAFVQLGINVSGADVGEAIAESNRVMEAITSALGDAGVDAKDIQTTNFNVWPEERFNPQTGESTGDRIFRVENTVRVTVRQVDSVGEVIDAGLSAGANQVYGLSFGIEDTAALEDEARLDAVADARARAEQLAAALGVELGEPIAISEGFGGQAYPVIERAAADGMGGGVPPISEGELTVSKQIAIVYAIAD